jgi:hypothetical protein
MTLSILTFCRSLNVFFFSQDRQFHLEDERDEAVVPYFFVNHFPPDRQLRLEDEGDDAVDPHIVDHLTSSSFLRTGSSILRMKGMTLSILTLSIT